MLPLFLKADYPIEKGFLIVPKFCLTFLGYWPEQKLTISLVIRLLINILILSYATVCEFAFGGIYIKQLLVALDAICPAATKGVTVLKLFIFFVYRKRFKKTIDQLRCDILQAANNHEKRKIVQLNASRAAILAAAVLTFSNLTNSSYFIRPLLSIAIQYFKAENITLELPFKVAGPDILIKEFPGYPISYLLLAYSGLVTVFGFSGADSYFLGFCSYISSVFEILQKDIEEIFAPISKNHNMATDVENEICFDKLKEIIIRHNRIINLADSFRTLYTPMIMGHFVSASIVICLSVIDVMMNTGFGIILYTFYTCAVLVQLFIYCLGGTQVIDSSYDIGSSLYQVEWYKCNTKVRKMMMLIILRSQRPTSISVPFFSPSLEAFGKVLSTTGSYVALVKTFL